MMKRFFIMVFFVGSALGADPPPWVEALRKGQSPGPELSQDLEAMGTWLLENLKPGHTTRDEVFEIIGDPRIQQLRWQDSLLKGELLQIPSWYLERPDRDQLESYQYHLWGADVNYLVLVVDFEVETGVLAAWNFSSAICGFCPHVLAHDGERLRLEGKMLAGRIGADRDGEDWMRLPSLKAMDGIARITLANWAPEIETLRDPQLLAVSVEPGEELDVGVDGEPALWTKIGETQPGEDFNGGQVIVVEARNTGEHEAYMRGVYLDHQPDNLDSRLQIRFDRGDPVFIQPVGTKFLRRIVIPVPKSATRFEFASESGFWDTRRVWLGKRSELSTRAIKIQPNNPTNEPIRLSPLDSVDYDFAVPALPNLQFALRLTGYYEFLKPVP